MRAKFPGPVRKFFLRGGWILFSLNPAKPENVKALPLLFHLIDVSSTCCDNNT
jgi:hypothetical protein